MERKNDTNSWRGATRRGDCFILSIKDCVCAWNVRCVTIRCKPVATAVLAVVIVSSGRLHLKEEFSRTFTSGKVEDIICSVPHIPVPKVDTMRRAVAPGIIRTLLWYMISWTRKEFPVIHKITLRVMILIDVTVAKRISATQISISLPYLFCFFSQAPSFPISAAIDEGNTAGSVNTI